MSFMEQTNFEEEEEIKREIEEYNLKECTVYAIDCKPSMFIKDEFKETPFIVALKSIRTRLLNKITLRPNDSMGIVLFNTKEKNNTANKEQIYVLQSLDTPDAERVKELDQLIQNESIIKERFGTSEEPFPFSDLFWITSDMLNGQKLALKRIILITDNDDPTFGNPVYKKTAIRKAKDLNDIGIEIILFGLNQSNQIFDSSIFYKDIVKLDDENKINDQVLSNIGNIDQLFQKLKTIDTNSRSEFRIPFKIAPDLTIGIRGYNRVIEQKVGTHKYFYSNQQQLQQVKSSTRWKCVDTNEYVTPIDMKRGYLYGGEYVVFTKEQVEKIHTITEPSLLILGFRERKALKAYHQISHPYFIYPDESQYKESKNVFFLLLDRLLKKNQIAICSLLRRSNATAKVVALLPQAEKLDKEGNQIEPPGFQLIRLPYADEIRAVPPYTVPVDYENGRDHIKEIIDKLLIKEEYNPLNYHNPFLGNFKNIIQSVALDEEKEFKDEIQPDYEWIVKSVGDEIEKFKKVVGLDRVIIEDFTAPSQLKRKIFDQDDNTDKKSRLRSMTIPEHWKEQTLNIVTNPSLKEFLTSVGIQPKKLKADLIQQVDEYFRIKQEQSI